MEIPIHHAIILTHDDVFRTPLFRSLCKRIISINPHSLPILPFLSLRYNDSHKLSASPGLEDKTCGFIHCEDLELLIQLCICLV